MSSVFRKTPQMFRKVSEASDGIPHLCQKTKKLRFRLKIKNRDIMNQLAEERNESTRTIRE